VGAIRGLARWWRAVNTAATPPQANTNPQIPIFTQPCCRIWLVVVIVYFAIEAFAWYLFVGRLL
jgi:hypothetical protein